MKSLVICNKKNLTNKKMMRIVSKTRLLSPLFLLPKPLLSGAVANQENTLDTIASPQFQFPESLACTRSSSLSKNTSDETETTLT
jgi:hypothetical protein